MLIIRALRELIILSGAVHPFEMAALLLLPILHLKSYETVNLRPQVICAARQALLIRCLYVRTAVDEHSVMVNTVNVEGNKSTKLVRRR
jgi:hypothetical protein